MKFWLYLKDKVYVLVLFIFMLFFISLLLLAYKLDIKVIIYIFLLLTLFVFTILIIDFLRKKSFYGNLISNISYLDKAYLVLETMEKPNFYEGELVFQALYEINKSMGENVKELVNQTEDFKEYVEMWIHEVKVPIASLVLMAHNHHDKFDKKILEQIRKIENYVEQVLYYVRQESAEKDYLIKENSLAKIISNVLLKNKNDLLENNIDLLVSDVNYKVCTDSKWLLFILNQIINNSIKYRRKKDAYIKIYAINNKETIELVVLDNGIGIESSDLPKVFDKTFTGKNGRMFSKSTGMGLYISKNLCSKLGHQINIESKYKEYTKVTIIFSKNEFYDVIKS